MDLVHNHTGICMPTGTLYLKLHTQSMAMWHHSHIFCLVQYAAILTKVCQLASNFLPTISLLHAAYFRLDSAGIYVVMFLHILRTLVKVSMVFSVLIVAYGLAFYMLLSHDVSKFAFWFLSLLSVSHQLGLA